MKKIMLTVWAIATVFLLNAQEKFYTEPVKIPVLLSGNFGELRGNHFHMGIDIKTEGRVGVPIHSTAAGYISRISIAPAGFGNALYITHLNGTTSVYAHLLKFRKDIEAYIRSLQYEKESFAIDWELPAGKFPVEKGEMIAQGGNSGSSAGPHLHFEIRDTRTQDAINPLKYNLFNIKDQTPPRVYAVQLYPLGDQSHVAGSTKKKRYQTVAAHGKLHLAGNPVIPVHGQVGFAILSNDFFDESHNQCGIYSAQLTVDGKEVFSYQLDRVPFSKTRYLNSHIDYEGFVASQNRFQKLWRDRGNKLDIYESGRNRGILTIDDQETHEVEITVADFHGNHTRVQFRIKGNPLSLPEKKSPGNLVFRYDEDNSLKNDQVELDCPDGAFYEDFTFNYASLDKTAGFYSRKHRLHDDKVPIHTALKLRIKAEDLPERLQNKAIIVKTEPATNSKISQGGSYADGWVTTDVRTLGTFAVTVDTIAPRITPLSIRERNALTESSQIRFRISDDLSGIKSYVGKIDGQWALFEYDAKYSLLTYQIDPQRLELKKRHTLELTVTDQCNNQSVYEATFWK